jgi:hypothetical protein
MGARNRVGICLSYWPARLHSLVKLVPWNRFLGSLKFKKFGLRILAVLTLNSKLGYSTCSDKEWLDTTASISSSVIASEENIFLRLILCKNGGL